MKKNNLPELIRLAIIGGCIILVTITIIQNRVKRVRVNNNPIVTIGYIKSKRIITGRRNPQIWIDYYFYSNDTIVYGSSCPKYSIGKQLEIGDKIKVRYDGDNPNNNLFHCTLSYE